MKYFVVNQRLKPDGKGALIPAFPLDDIYKLAEKRADGSEVVVLMPADEPRRSVKDNIVLLAARLVEYGFEPEDAIVLTGDPMLMAFTVMVTTQAFGCNFSVLCWSKFEKCYCEAVFRDTDDIVVHYHT